MLVFSIGRVFGGRISNSKRFGKYVDPRQNSKLNLLRTKYGAWACGIFRFTPGIRFPGHLSCGIIQIPYWKFALIDGGAALFSVPTQVILVAFYGEMTLTYFKQFKILLFSGLGIIAIGYGVYRFSKWLLNKRNTEAKIIPLPSQILHTTDSMQSGPPEGKERRSA